MVKDYVCGRCVFALKTNKLIINNWYMGFHLTQVTTTKRTEFLGNTLKQPSSMVHNTIFPDYTYVYHNMYVDSASVFHTLFFLSFFYLSMILLLFSTSSHIAVAEQK